jgi:hypothetical protein
LPLRQCLHPEAGAKEIQLPSYYWKFSDLKKEFVHSKSGDLSRALIPISDVSKLPNMPAVPQAPATIADILNGESICVSLRVGFESKQTLRASDSTATSSTTTIRRIEGNYMRLKHTQDKHAMEHVWVTCFEFYLEVIIAIILMTHTDPLTIITNLRLSYIRLAETGPRRAESFGAKLST